MPQIPIKYCIYKQLLEDVLLLSNQENLRASACPETVDLSVTTRIAFLHN
ncbi:hypothetical protein IMCC3135_04485 [Granulosicoccus antarcticus IMCC3135]|uniref:Uncharacterized protein n=1 Tax=Granulosicoccus antarcticus IMCC3135 TaxID=1192854 RepID=A0A2Z2NQD0_9GAMM|nr:hypothetical protein IMCC3135_04485 [Granulosicoccus antarcticus IMCC3135]